MANEPASYQSEASRTDAQIVQDVGDELRLEPSIRRLAINVEVADGVVTLTGVVADASEQRLIETAARRIAGVDGITSRLQIALAAVRSPTDDEISQDCEDRLASLLPVSDYAVTVMTSHGRVTLRGLVRTGGERWIAESAISSVDGVNGINCQIEVECCST